MGKNGGLRGRLLLDDDRPRMEIIEIKVQEEPAEVNAMESEEGVEEVINENGAAETQALDDSGDNLLETEGLLRDVPAPIVVELGRIRLNTSQVVRLRRGQILRLPRGSNDPVDLVVNGKLFARGELIEVDGELGVRLLKMSSS
jgi:flagellar motor switch protein FliM